MLPEKVILVRHGETAWNQAGKFLGQSNPGLNKKGEIQAQATASLLRGEKIDLLFSSDLLRAVETSRAIAGHNVPVKKTPSLREMNFGEWEGLTFDEIQTSYSVLLSEWMKDPFKVRIPGGETAEEVMCRVINAWNYIALNTLDAKTVAIVAHGGTLRLLLCYLIGIEPVRHWEFSLGHGEFIVLVKRGEIYSILNKQI